MEKDLVLETDEEIIKYMSESSNVDDWNKRKEEVKHLRDLGWIIKNIDGSGLIVKANIPENPRKEKPPYDPSKSSRRFQKQV